jgi:hypothetical protein
MRAVITAHFGSRLLVLLLESRAGDVDVKVTVFAILCPVESSK